jgi:hypothetical protein
VPTLDISEILAQTEGAKLPPVSSWNPPLSGDIDIVIEKDGSWIHEGTLMSREKLVVLFASILKREGDDYFLVTPVEKWRIRVKDLPFVIVAMDHQIDEQAHSMIRFVTNLGEAFDLDKEHRLQVNRAEDGSPLPEVLVRSAGLYARISRSVFYQLVDIAQERLIDGTMCYAVCSDGEWFSLGEI